MVHPGGRPPKYEKTEEGIEEFQSKVDNYFAICDKSHKIYSICELACHLDMDRSSLQNYSKEKEFFPIIKKARERVEASLERSMLDSEKAPVGVIFALKNHYKWTDKQEIENTHGLKDGQEGKVIIEFINSDKNEK